MGGMKMVVKATLKIERVAGVGRPVRVSVVSGRKIVALVDLEELKRAAADLTQIEAAHADQ
jgi:hypothetical protein